MRQIAPTSFGALLVACATLLVQPLWAESGDHQKLIDRYNKDIKPLFSKYCFECHGKQKAKGSIDLESIPVSWASFRNEHHLLDDVRALVIDEDMPPPKYAQPSTAERKQMVDWLVAFRNTLAQEHAGDPGAVVLRRLTRTEYLNTTQNLTGLDLDLASLLPTDAAGGEGFANVGSVQPMSDAVLAKYLAVAKRIASHARISPHSGITFASTPVPKRHGERVREVMDRIQDVYDEVFQTSMVSRFGDDAPSKLVGSVRYHQLILLACWQRLHADVLGLDPGHVHKALGVPKQVVDDTWNLIHSDYAVMHPFIGLRKALTDLPAPASAADRKPQAVTTRLHDILLRISAHWDTLRKSDGKGSGKNGRTTATLVIRSNHKFVNGVAYLHLQNVSNEQTDTIIKIDPRYVLQDQIIPRAHIIQDDFDQDISTNALKKRHKQKTGNTEKKNKRTDKKAAQPNIKSKKHGQKNKNKSNKQQSKQVALRLPAIVPLRLGKKDGEVRLRIHLNNKDGHPALVTASVTAQADDTPVWSAHYLPLFNAQGWKEYKAYTQPLIQHFGDFAGRIMKRGPASHLSYGVLGLPSGSVRFRKHANDYLYVRQDQQLTYFLPKYLPSLNLAWQDLDYIHPPTEFRYRILLATLLKRAYPKLPDLITSLQDMDILDAETASTAQKEYSAYRPEDGDKRDQHKMFIDRFLEDKQLAKIGSLLLAADSNLKNKAKVTAEDRQQAKDLQAELIAIQTATEDAAANILAEFAKQVFRRPVTATVKEDLLTGYHALRKQGDDFDTAMRGMVVRMLLSPYFLYHWQQAEAQAVTELNAHELANRLAYFLWTSPPDEQLRQAALQGDMTRKEGIRNQVQRLMTDPRAAAFANEFFGSWFGYRDFLSHDGPDRRTYPEYGDELKHSLDKEIRLFFADLVRNDRSIDTILDGKQVFHNGRLKQHYGYQVQHELMDQSRVIPSKRKGSKALPPPVWSKDGQHQIMQLPLVKGNKRGCKYHQKVNTFTVAASDRLLLTCAIVGDKPLSQLTIDFYHQGTLVTNKKWRPLPAGRSSQQALTSAGINILPTVLPRWSVLEFKPDSFHLSGKTFDAIAISIAPGGLEVRSLILDQSARGFARHSLAEQDPRRGILGMGALLTKLSTPHRTSPIKRGAWVLGQLLNRRLPPPPNEIPDLPEVVKGGKNQRELLRMHREQANCAACHNEIDPLGLALESFDLMGRPRSTDINGLSVTVSETLPDGHTLDGVHSLRSYLIDNRGRFRQLFCRKLLGFALGREVLPGDSQLLEEMQKLLEQNDGRMSSAIAAIAHSTQFRQRRNQEQKLP